jgi:uncharacterized membrane protein
MSSNLSENEEPWSLPVVFPVLAVLLSLVGFADSVYLTVTSFTGEVVPCDLVTGCEKVLSSEYSEIFGIPISALGAVAYFLAFSLSAFAYNQNKVAWNLFSLMTLGMAGFSVWLIYLQAFVIGAFCQFCLISAGSSISLFLLAAASALYKKIKNS